MISLPSGSAIIAMWQTGVVPPHWLLEEHGTHAPVPVLPVPPLVEVTLPVVFV